MRSFLVFLVALALVGCGRSQVRNHFEMDKDRPVLKIAVFVDGRLSVDGEPSSIQALRQSLRGLAKEHGVVWYYREGGKKEPPPIATEVINEVIQARVPIRLSSKPDYSDSVTSP